MTGGQVSIKKRSPKSKPNVQSVDIEEIDPCKPREPVKAAYVKAPGKSSGRRGRRIRIEYGGAGFIPLEEPAKTV